MCVCACLCICVCYVKEKQINRWLQQAVHACVMCISECVTVMVFGACESSLTGL